MPITSQWANPDKTIVYFIYEQPWSAPEFQAAVLEINKLLDTVNYPVDMIIQVRGGMPNLGNSVPFRTVMRNFHSNIRYTALVGANDLFRRTVTAFMRVIGQDHPFFFAATVEEAHKRLAERNTRAGIEEKTP